MKAIRIATSCSTLALLIASLPGNADNFGASFSVLTQFSDNAYRTEADKVEERQDKYALSVAGDYENQLIEADASYTFSENRFEKSSQPDRNLLEGKSQLRIGKESQLLDVLFMHSRRALLNTPDAIDLLRNQDERDVYSVIPTFHAAVTPVDGLMLRGTYTKVDYRYNEERNAESLGAIFLWQHKLSAVDTFEVSAQQSEIEFTYFPNADYKYQSVMINYMAKLRQLDYGVSLGYNKSLPDIGEEYSSPTYSAHANYTAATHQFTLYADQRITDTSLGDGNRMSLDGGFDSGDVGSNQIDQIERRSVEARWNSSFLCERCTVSAHAIVRDDEYLNLDLDNNEFGGGVGMSYQLSKASSISANVSRTEQRFTGSANNVNVGKFTLDRARIEYHYRFINDLSLRLFAERRERGSEDGFRNYEESIGGLSLNYSF